VRTRWLPGPAAYEPIWQAMREFTAGRTPDTPDELWLLEHAPVYTLGQAGRRDHLLDVAGIPVVHCDRGGQVTYHGPGQLMAYALVDLRRRGLYVKNYVALLEDVVISSLDDMGLAARRLPGAPGVYVEQHGALAKIAALGLRVRGACAYHGLSLNVDMDLAPFDGINPCGYAGMATTDLRSCGVSWDLRQVGEHVAARLTAALDHHHQRPAHKEKPGHDNHRSTAAH